MAVMETVVDGACGGAWAVGGVRAVRCWLEAVNRQVQLVNGGRYLRGLIEEGARKSLEPMVARLGGEADYESLQQFLGGEPVGSGTGGAGGG